MTLNSHFKLTAEQLKQINTAMKPVVEDILRVTVLPEGNIIFATNDTGFVAEITIPTMDIISKEPAQFYVNKKNMEKITSVATDIVEFSTNENGLFKVIVDGTELNLQLPLEEIDVDTSYNESIVEKKPSEWLTQTIKKISVSKTGGSPMLNSMYWGEDVKYGSSDSLTIIKEGFENIKINIEPEFLRYMNAVTSFGATVDFIVDKDNNQFVIRNGNVIYKTNLLSVELPDTEEMLEREPEAYVRFAVPTLLKSLTKLEIPLLGMKEASFNFSMSDKNQQALISVKDMSNHVSTDRWNMVSPKGEANVDLNLTNFKNTIAVMGEDFEMKVHEDFTVLASGTQNTILMNYV